MFIKNCCWFRNGFSCFFFVLTYIRTYVHIWNILTRVSTRVIGILGDSGFFLHFFISSTAHYWNCMTVRVPFLFCYGMSNYLTFVFHFLPSFLSSFVDFLFYLLPFSHKHRHLSPHSVILATTVEQTEKSTIITTYWALAIRFPDQLSF